MYESVYVKIELTKETAEFEKKRCQSIIDTAKVFIQKTNYEIIKCKDVIKANEENLRYLQTKFPH